MGIAIRALYLQRRMPALQGRYPVWLRLQVVRSSLAQRSRRQQRSQRPVTSRWPRRSRRVLRAPMHPPPMASLGEPEVRRPMVASPGRWSAHRPVRPAVTKTGAVRRRPVSEQPRR